MGGTTVGGSPLRQAGNEPPANAVLHVAPATVPLREEKNRKTAATMQLLIKAAELIWPAK